MASRAHALSCKPSCSASHMPSPSPSTPLSLTPAAPSSAASQLRRLSAQRRLQVRSHRRHPRRWPALASWPPGTPCTAHTCALVAAESATSAGPYGRTAASHWALGGRAAVTSAEHSQEPGEPGHGGHGGELWRCREAAISTLPRVSASETLQVQPRPHSHSAHMHSSLAQTPRLMAPLKASFFSGGPPETTGSADADADACCSQSCAA